MLRDVLDSAVNAVKSVKTEHCKNGPGDISPVVQAFRGDEPVALVWLHDQDRDEILSVFNAAAAGFDADSLTACFETFVSVDSEGLNPLTGRTWEPGEMQQAAAEHDGVAKGWVHEAVAVTAVNRAGDYLFSLTPYTYAGSAFFPGDARILVWGNPRITTAEMLKGRNGGRMMESMLAAMRTPSASTVFPDFQNSEASRAERDARTAQVLSNLAKCHVGLWAGSHESDRIAVVEEFARRLRDS